jgi:hypothetical protein
MFGDMATSTTTRASGVAAETVLRWWGCLAGVALARAHGDHGRAVDRFEAARLAARDASSVLAAAFARERARWTDDAVAASIRSVYCAPSPEVPPALIADVREAIVRRHVQAEERAAAEARVAEDRAFRAMVRAWQRVDDGEGATLRARRGQA